MEQISNKTLILLLLIAIVVSITGTIISINRINQLILQIPRITGLGTTTTGVVNISLAKVSSISIVDSQITFGSCTPNASTGTNLTSNNSNEWGAPGVCTSGTYSAPDNITIKNDGNANINVSVKTNVLASTFIGGSLPYGPLFMFSVRNATDYPGCFNATAGIDDSEITPTGMQWDWKNFTTANENYLACANLTPTKNYDSMYVFAKIFLPYNVEVGTGKNATLTFTATSW